MIGRMHSDCTRDRSRTCTCTAVLYIPCPPVPGVHVHYCRTCTKKCDCGGPTLSRCLLVDRHISLRVYCFAYSCSSHHSSCTCSMHDSCTLCRSISAWIALSNNLLDPTRTLVFLCSSDTCRLCQTALAISLKVS
eukprot:SAG22_NODE_4567_length_1231_cov_2.060954_2_plen_135_part_00